MLLVVSIVILYILAEDQLFEVMDELPGFTNWMELGANLGLNIGVLEVIKANSKLEGGVFECLLKVLVQWLKRNHNEAKFGPPTWSNLARAVQPIDSALAIKIRERKLRLLE